MDANDYLRKMQKHAIAAVSYCNGCTYEEFQSDEMLMDACLHNVGQIGEMASKAIEDKCHKDYPSIMWKEMKGLRNRIYHDYDGINRKLIWEIISDNLPSLIKEIDMLISK